MRQLFRRCLRPNHRWQAQGRQTANPSSGDGNTGRRPRGPRRRFNRLRVLERAQGGTSCRKGRRRRSQGAQWLAGRLLEHRSSPKEPHSSTIWALARPLDPAPTLFTAPASSSPTRRPRFASARETPFRHPLQAGNSRPLAEGDCRYDPAGYVPDLGFNLVSISATYDAGLPLAQTDRRRADRLYICLYRPLRSTTVRRGRGEHRRARSSVDARHYERGTRVPARLTRRLPHQIMRSAARRRERAQTISGRL